MEKERLIFGKKTERINFGLTKAEKLTIEMAAENNGRSQSSIIRYAIRKVFANEFGESMKILARKKPKR